MELSIIINYNTKTLVENAINSIYEHTNDLKMEIIVVDNSNKIEEKYIATREEIKVYTIENQGFGNACNIGAGKSNGTYLLFLNSDTLMHTGTLKHSLEYLSCEDNVGALGVQTLLENAELDHGCKRGFPTPIASACYFAKLDRLFPNSRKCGAYRQTFIKERDIAEVDVVSGSYLMMPREVFEEIGGFNEAFFMYGEDVDLCYRIKEAGYRVVYYGQSSITHLKGQSGLYTKSDKVIKYFYDAMIIFYDEHYKSKYSKLTTALIHFAINVKYKRTISKQKRKYK